MPFLQIFLHRLGPLMHVMHVIPRQRLNFSTPVKEFYKHYY